MTLNDSGDGVLRSTTRALLRSLAAVALFSFFGNLLLLVLPLYTMQLFDRVIVSRSLDTLTYLTLVALFALAVLAGFDLVRSRLLVILGGWFEARLAPTVFHGLVDAALSGRAYQAESLRDLAGLRGFVMGGGMVPLFDAPWVPVFILATYLLHPVLGEVALVAAIALVGLALVGELAARRSVASGASAAMKADRLALAVARNAEAVDAMGMAEAMLQHWFAMDMEVLGHTHRAGIRAGGLSALTKFVRLGVQVVLMAAGASLVLDHQITGGAMIAASIIMARALAPIEQAIGGLRQLMAARIAYRHLRHHLAEARSDRGKMAPPGVSGRLSVEGLGLVPRGQSKPALENINLTLEPGEALAVIGPAAAGKSTLARLMVGLSRGSAGTVRLDGADIAAWPRPDIGRHLGYLPQNPNLIPGTVADNIARFSGGSVEEIVAAAKLAHLHEAILRLPQGYETVVGETDPRLSGGQRQRIALARALYGSPRLVVLDEPNSSLDSEGEAALARTIQSLKARRVTLVVITHRLDLVTLADKVLALREGKVDLYGPLQAFLDRLSPRPVEAIGRHLGRDEVA